MLSFSKARKQDRLGHILAGGVLICALTLSSHCNGVSSNSPASPSVHPTPYDSGSLESIQDVDKDVGFRFILPSYLPETVDLGYSVLRTHGAEDLRYESVTVSFRHKKDTQPFTEIDIREQRPEPGQTFSLLLPDEEVHDVSGVEVHCGLGAGETRTPEFLCTWNTDEINVAIYFDWMLPETLPGGITSEMHDEAMKVVISMIEDPYVP